MFNKTKPAGDTDDAVNDVSPENDASTESYRVTNLSTVALQIGDVNLKVGASAQFNDFNPDDAKYAAWINANMLSVEPA